MSVILLGKWTKRMLFFSLNIYFDSIDEEVDAVNVI